MKIQINIKLFYFLIFLISSLSLLIAIYIEKALGHMPCSLCLYQRIPYLLAIFVCFIGYNFNKNLIWLYLLLLIFISSAALSGYHTGVENNIFSELSSCKNENVNIIDKTKLLDSLKESNVSCKDVNFRIFGFSLATINFVISIIIAAMILFNINYEKNR
tara:strand:+ start:29 stop:508 length:480 start_codon:yes stop_codon:yes gene_type:complete